MSKMREEKQINDWKEELGVLLLDVFLKSKPKAQKYPLGQLEKRVGDFVQSQLSLAHSQGVKEEREKNIREFNMGILGMATTIGYEWDKNQKLSKEILDYGERIVGFINNSLTPEKESNE